MHKLRNGLRTEEWTYLHSRPKGALSGKGCFGYVVRIRLKSTRSCSSVTRISTPTTPALKTIFQFRSIHAKLQPVLRYKRSPRLFAATTTARRTAVVYLGTGETTRTRHLIHWCASSLSRCDSSREMISQSPYGSSLAVPFKAFSL